jgi:hypothetical protein
MGAVNRLMKSKSLRMRIQSLTTELRFCATLWMRGHKRSEIHACLNDIALIA